MMKVLRVLVMAPLLVGCAQRARWGPSLAAGWVATAVLAPVVGWLAGGLAFPAGLVIAAVSLTAGYIAMPESDPHPAASGGTQRAASPRAEVPLRMVMTVVLVVMLALATAAMGPVVGGILAALPALASVLAAFTHRRDGPVVVVALLRGMLSGLSGFVVFCAVLALLLVPAGTATAFAVAAATAVAVQAALLATDHARSRTVAAGC